jgi:hypothetical protein
LAGQGADHRTLWSGAFGERLGRRHKAIVRPTETLLGEQHWGLMSARKLTVHADLPVPDGLRR